MILYTRNKHIFAAEFGITLEQCNAKYSLGAHKRRSVGTKNSRFAIVPPPGLPVEFAKARADCQSDTDKKKKKKDRQKNILAKKEHLSKNQDI